MYPFLSSILFLFLLLNLAGCSKAHDPRLERINALTVTDPKAAMAVLDSIDTTDLGETDRHYHDLLTVKASFKAFKRQTSDSLIKTVISYYDDHGDDTLRAEALYYGGAVYVDLGDYPTSINYLHQSLKLIGTKIENSKLRSLIVSALGSECLSLRLWKQSIPYLEESITLDSILGDSVGMMHDFCQMGFAYMRLKKYDFAESCYRKAYKLAQLTSAIHAPSIAANLAGLLYERGNLNDALSLIRPLPALDTLSSRNTTLAYAAKIYLDAGIPDTAKLYAAELIHSSSPLNKLIGYEVMLSPAVKALNLPDSTAKYVDDYIVFTTDYLNGHDAQSGAVQNAYYDYTLHLHEKESAEKERNKAFVWLAIAVAIIIVLLVIVGVLRYRNIRHLLRLHESLDILNALQKSMENRNNPETSPARDADSLRRSIVGRMESIAKGVSEPVPVCEDILQSWAYNEARKHLSSKKAIIEKNPLWDELENVILQSSPRFKEYMLLLSGGSMKTDEYHLSILIKCGFTPTETITLIGKTKGSLSYWRKQLGKHIFDQKPDLKVLDDIIRSL